LRDFVQDNSKLLLISFLLLGVGFVLFPVWSFSVKLDPFIYHYSNILWNETYPVVPGLANLDEKYGFNSNYFLLSSLFSFRFLFEELIVGIQSILAFLIAGSFIYEIIKNKFDIKPVIAFILYFILIYFNQNDLSEPSTDIIPTLITFYIFTRIILNPAILKNDFLFFIIVPVTIITFKLSAAPILLIILIPIVMLIKCKRYKASIAIFSLSTAIIVFWLIRNTIISGYLVFPLYEIDIFSFDWKTPMEVVKTQKDFIHSYSINKTFNTLQNIDTGNYFFYSTTLVLFVGMLSIAVGLSNFLLRLKTWKNNKIYWFIYAVLLINLLFWAISAPDVRFGYGYIFATIFFAVHSSINDKAFVPKADKYAKNYKFVIMFFLLSISTVWAIYGYKWASKYKNFLTVDYGYTSSMAWKEALTCPIKLQYMKEREWQRENERFNDSGEFTFTKHPLNNSIDLYISPSRSGFVFDKIPAGADCNLDKSTFHDYRRVEARGDKINEGFRYRSYNKP